MLCGFHPNLQGMKQGVYECYGNVLPISLDASSAFHVQQAGVGATWWTRAMPNLHPHSVRCGWWVMHTQHTVMHCCILACTNVFIIYLHVSTPKTLLFPTLSMYIVHVLQDVLIDRFLKNASKMPMMELNMDLDAAMQEMLNSVPVRHGGRKVKRPPGARNLVARGPSWAPQYTEEEVSAYLVSRFAGCYSSAWAVLEQLRWRGGGWAPKTMLDYGAGPGTATWAAAEVPTTCGCGCTTVYQGMHVCCARLCFAHLHHVHQPLAFSTTMHTQHRNTPPGMAQHPAASRCCGARRTDDHHWLSAATPASGPQA